MAFETLGTSFSPAMRPDRSGAGEPDSGLQKAVQTLSLRMPSFRGRGGIGPLQSPAGAPQGTNAAVIGTILRAILGGGGAAAGIPSASAMLAPAAPTAQPLVGPSAPTVTGASAGESGGGGGELAALLELIRKRLLLMQGGQVGPTVVPGAPQVVPGVWNPPPPEPPIEVPPGPSPIPGGFTPGGYTPPPPEPSYGQPEEELGGRRGGRRWS